MVNDILDPSALLSSLPTLLPPAARRLASPHAGIAALIHTAMTALAFRLIAVDDAAPARSILTNVLPDEWSAHGPGNFTFRYRHEQSSLEFVLKVVKLGSRTLVNAIAVESDKAASLDLATLDFVSPSFYPHDFNTSNAAPLVHGYISSNRVSDLMSQFKSQVVSKLIPGLQKEGYIEQTADSSTNAGPIPRQPTSPTPARRQPPLSPYAQDERYYSPPHIPPENPLEIGRRDLDPFPANPGLFGGPPPLFPGSGGDGMYVGPNHPIFGNRREPGSGIRGPWGGDGFLPPMGAPPGARFDPIGPSFGPLGGFRGRGPRGGGPPGPDNDEFMPPGMGDMYS